MGKKLNLTAAIESKNETIKKLLYLSALVIALMIGLSPFVMGQATTENTKNTPDQTLRSNARINPSTLAMEFSIPIADFPGRGGMSMPLVFNYSSKVWRFELTGYGQTETVKYTTNAPRYAEGSAAGWTSSFGNARIESYQEIYDCHGNPLGELQDGSSVPPPTSGESPQGYCGQGVYYINRLRIKLPDGSTQTLLKDDSVHDSGSDPISWAGTYLATDGSRSRLELTSNSGGILYLPDGSKYYFNSDHEGYKYEDRNGNVINFNTSTRTWTDTLGRSLTSPLPLNLLEQYQTVGTQSFNMPGLTGTSYRTYQMVWKNLGDSSVLLDSNEQLAYDGNKNCPVGTSESNALFFGSLETRICKYSQFNPVVLTEIILPGPSGNQAKYKFWYNKYGEITKIQYPTGASERFEYDEVAGLAYKRDMVHDQTNRGVTDRWVKENDNATEMHWKYEAFKEAGGTNSTNILRIKTTAPDNQTITEQFVETNWSNDFTNAKTKWGFENPVAGQPYEERAYSGTTLKSRRLLEYDYDGKGVSNTAAPRDPKLKREISIIFEPNDSDALVSMKTYTYDTSGSIDEKMFAWANLKATEQYNYIVVSKTSASAETISQLTARFSTITPAVKTETDYSYDTNYVNSARSVLGMATEQRVINPSTNTVVSKSQMRYDEYSFESSGSLPTFAASTWQNPSHGYRGNITSVRSYTSISNNQYIETHTYFDQYGNPRKAVDGNGNLSEIEYNANNYACAYPTKTISAIPDPYGTHGASASLTTEATYDFNTGLTLTTKDVNGQTTEMQYNDLLLRPTKVIAPNGHQTISEYGVADSSGLLPPSQRFIKLKTQFDSTMWKESYSWFDGLARSTKTQVVDSNGDIFTETEYDNMGRPKRATNPYRMGETKLWTETTYDAFGRVWKITAPDTSVLVSTYGLAISGSQIGTSITATDQALKERRSITNGLGQLTRVDEATSSGLGAISSPNQPTTYSYDILNNLIQVQQTGMSAQQCGGSYSPCTQTRNFVYDDISRLKSASLPESGTTTYTYDNNGNVTQKIDARSVQTNTTYDALNRVKTRAFQNELNYTTPAVNYYYDNQTNAKGQLIKISSSVSTTEYTSFDTMGRITGHKQTTDGNNYTTSYTYNLSGALLEETYPSTRVVKSTRSANGNLSKIDSKKNSADFFRNYAGSFVYTSVGAISSVKLGNGKFETVAYNSRLQPIQIALGSSLTDAGLLKLNYDYGTTNNNGDVLSQTITVNRNNQSPLVFNQSYTYDSLDRLEQAVEMTGTTQNWKQTYVFDRYGNRKFNVSNNNTTTLPQSFNANIYNPTVDVASNRFTTGQGYTYDLAGNLLTDADGRIFSYDAENKQKDAKNSQSQVIGQYYYDGAGKRVKKISNMESVIFVYNVFGKLVAEYSTQLSQTPRIKYLTRDHLGSTRITTNELGSVASRSDYMPFGEEISGLGNRTSTDKYAPDDIRPGFTAYLKDDETNLEFAEARMYNNALGRFTTVDPLLASGDAGSPQTFNRYAYVINNPLKFTDPTGMICCDAVDDQLKAIIKDVYGRTWTGPDGEEVQMTEEALQSITEKVLPEMRNEYNMAYNAQWNINDQANNGGVAVESTVNNTNTTTTTTNPTTVTLQAGASGSQELGGSVETGKSGATIAGKQIGGVTGGGAATYTVAPGVSKTVGTTITDGPNGPKQQMSAAQGNINTGADKMAASIEKGQVKVVNPVVGQSAGMASMSTQSKTTYNLTETRETNIIALRQAKELGISKANKDNPVKKKGEK